MKCALIFTLLATVACSSWAAPLDLSDLFLARNAAVDEQPAQDVVKRQVQGNADGQLKQVSFQTLIGNLEDSLFQSALSLNGASASDVEVTEVKPGQPEPVESNEQHAIKKRSVEEVAGSLSTTQHADVEERKILVQTTKKVPLSEDGVPAHLIIDHVSVLPHSGAFLPLIPTFQVHRTKITSATITEDANNDSSDGKQTKISITKTSITSTAPVETLETQSSSTNPAVIGTTEKPETSSASSEESTSSSSTTTTTTTTTTSSTSSTTVDQPIVQQKQVEEKLKAKVAEVEAEPVILTARV